METNNQGLAKEEKVTITSYELYFSLYHQLADKESDEDDNDDEAVSKLASLFSPDFFDLIIVDECHRGSAKKDSKSASGKEKDTEGWK